MSFNYSGLIFFRAFDGYDFEARLEKFLPRGFSVGVSPGFRIPQEDGHRAYWFYAGPRKYFEKDHGGVFVGVEPFVGTVQDGGWERVAGVPITFGYVSQYDRISTGMNAGLGPGYRWTPGARDGQGFEMVGMIDINVGFTF